LNHGICDNFKDNNNIIIKMNIYEELRKKRPAHPSIGPEFRSDSSSSTSTAYEPNENSQPTQQVYTQPREINFFPASTSFAFVTGPPSKNHWKVK